MAISQFYKDNSTEYNKVIGNTPITFKATNDNIMHLFADSDFDVSAAISSNAHEFFHAFQTDNEFKVSVNFIAGSHFTDNPNYKVVNPVANKICLLYSENNMDNIYSREEGNFYLYSNNSKVQNYSNLNDFTGFKVVTDFDFSRLVVVPNLADSKFSRETINYNYIDNLQDNNFNNYYLQLFYRNDDYTLTNISGYFALAEIVTLENDIIINMLTFRNVLGEQMWNSGSIMDADDFTSGCAMINDSVFIHTPTSTIFVSSDGYDRFVPNDEKVGLWCPFYYSSGYHVPYDVVVDLSQATDITAALGLPFITCAVSNITDKNSYDENIKLAFMDDTGYVDFKNILHGTDEIENSDTHNKNIDLNTSPDIPDKPNPYPTTDDKIKPVDYRYINEIGGFTRYYRVSRSQLAQIVSNINTATDLPDGYEFLPHIVSVRQYPFNTAQYVHGTTKNIVIGGYDTGVVGYDLDSTQMSIQTIATITIPNKYSSFLDKSPYTQLSLYIPFCSWVDLPDICVGRTITVELAHDIINGGCIGIVKLEGMPIVQTSGKMGTDISISATENGLKQAALTQAAFAVGGGVLSTGFALSTGNPVGVFSGIMSAASALSQGNIANNSNYTHQIGNTGDKSNDHISNKCYLRISFPITDIPKNFAHTYGYICNQTHKLSECKGFTVCDKVDLSGVTATENEKVRLRQILESGFYC